MSVATELTRIKNAKSDLKTSINAKTDAQHQITNETIDEYADFVDSIQSGGGDISEYFSNTIYSGTSYLGGWVSSVIKLPAFSFSGTNCSYMFYNTNAVEIDLSNFDTSNTTSFQTMFQQATRVLKLDLSAFNSSKVTNMSAMFQNTNALAVLDISGMDFSSPPTNISGMFAQCGDNCLAINGAYADKMPYVYVKDQIAQNWVLTANNGRPNTWSTNNVVIAGSAQDLRS